MTKEKALQRKLRLIRKRMDLVWKRVVRAERVHDRYEEQEKKILEQLIFVQTGIKHGQEVQYNGGTYRVHVRSTGNIVLRSEGGRSKLAPALQAYLAGKSVSPFVQRTLEEQRERRKQGQTSVRYRTEFDGREYRVKTKKNSFGDLYFSVQKKSGFGNHFFEIHVTKELKAAVGWLGAEKRQALERARRDDEARAEYYP